jgi:hypothetical protein
VTSPPLTSQDRSAFYVAAVLGLRALDARERTPRRFGADADARWTQFAGALGAGDRLEILLRDGAGTWGAAFSPSACFGFFGLADDEPFGPDWGGIDENAAKKLLADASGSATIDGVATALGVNAAPVAVPPLTPSTKLVVAGGAALVALAKAFVENRALSWTDQVVAAADRAAFRQLAGLAAVLLGARGRTVIVRPSAEAVNVLRAAGFAHLDAAIVSPDAEPEAADLARTVGGK